MNICLQNTNIKLEHLVERNGSFLPVVFLASEYLSIRLNEKTFTQVHLD